jgi:hypothetical protein
MQVKELQVRLVAVIQVNECCRYVFIWASGFDTGSVTEQEVSTYLPRLDPRCRQSSCRLVFTWASCCDAGKRAAGQILHGLVAMMQVKKVQVSIYLGCWLRCR